MKWWRLFALCAVLSHSVAAQVAPGLPRIPTQATGRPDSTRRDTALVKWPDADSTTRALLALPGYDKAQTTHYKSDTALFDVTGRDLVLLPDSGKKVYVQMGSRLVISDSSVDYREIDSTATFGGHYILHDPTSGQADVHGLGLVTYDLAHKSALLSNAHMKYNTSGADWFMETDLANMSTGGGGQTFYSGPGTLTSCDDSIPDYHFAFGEAKRTSDKTMLMRPVMFYIADIPVMWFPFMFETNQGGRQSGVLTPQFGINDIVRTSSAYHRSVNNVGYYWASDDYNDVEAWFDWRSSLGANSVDDPGYIDYNAVWNYNWLNEFLTGNAGVSYTQEGDGSTNLHVSLNHTEKFAHNGNLNATINYVTNTTIQRQNSYDPVAALATIQSQVSYSEQLGPATISFGGTRTQHPGREQVDESFPSLQITTPEIAVANWLTWTPNFSFSTTQSLHIDQPGTFTYAYGRDSAGLRDSTLLDRSQSTAALTFNTPVKFFGQDIGNSFAINSTVNNYPEEFTIFDPITGDSTGSRVYAKTFEETIDWVPQYALPSIGRNLLNISPTVAFGDVDPGPFWIKTERTNGQFVSQSKRLTFGLSAAPTIFGFFPGFGPFLGFRHSLSPTLSYGYAPAASVPTAYLAATGRSQAGYLGALAENQVSLGLSQSIEGKLLTPGDTDVSKTQKLKLVSLTVTPLSYDFTRLSAPEITNKKWWRGLTTQNWGYSLNSDLLPGFSFTTDYSLFQGSTTSDTAVFKPVLDNVSASLNMSDKENPLTVITKFFLGKKVLPPPPRPVRDTSRDSTSDSTRAQGPALPTTENGVLQSTRANLNKVAQPFGQGWHLNLNYSSSIPRPPEGGRIIDIDPQLRCQQIAGANPFLLAQCITELQTTPTAEQPITSTTVGGPSYLVSPTTNIGADLGFNLTPKWAVTWRTNYDVVHRQFASHVVTLSRDLHDWRALFGFTQSPNGNFAFTFTIALKADPDLKFDYNRASVRSGEPF